jgi:hypothetical protein
VNVCLFIFKCVQNIYECPYIYDTLFPLVLGFDYMEPDTNKFQNEKKGDIYGEDKVRKPDRFQILFMNICVNLYIYLSTYHINL